LLLSFIDIFRWSAIIAGAAAILGWLFRKVKHHDDAAGLSH